jgi:RNA polymerase sigma-70 factor (ECF subfamily)
VGACRFAIARDHRKHRRIPTASGDYPDVREINGTMSARSVTRTGAPTLGAVFGDDTAFRAWYEDVLPRVHGYLLLRCGYDRDLAEELTQETFVEALRAGNLPASAEPVAWLIGIARHRLIDHYRREERRERGLRRLAQRHAPDIVWVGSSQWNSDLVAALRRLPAAQRAAIVLRYLDDLPVKEVAVALGRSEGACESLLSRGRETLRHELGGPGHG